MKRLFFLFCIVGTSCKSMNTELGTITLGFIINNSITCYDFLENKKKSVSIPYQTAMYFSKNIFPEKDKFLQKEIALTPSESVNNVAACITVFIKEKVHSLFVSDKNNDEDNKTNLQCAREHPLIPGENYELNMKIDADRIYYSVVKKSEEK